MTYAVSQHAEVPLLSLPDDWSGAITTLEIEIDLCLFFLLFYLFSLSSSPFYLTTPLLCIEQYIAWFLFRYTLR